jgi:hypothetical protein
MGEKETMELAKVLEKGGYSKKAKKEIIKWYT